MKMIDYLFHRDMKVKKNLERLYGLFVRKHLHMVLVRLLHLHSVILRHPTKRENL